MEEERLDLFSNLPDEILRHIVHFLPLKLAARTSVLSTAWRSFWMASHAKLDIDLEHMIGNDIEEEVVRIVSTFLGSCNGLGLWRLCLCCPLTNKLSSKMVDKLILSATMGAEGELHLDLSEGQQATSDFTLNLVLNYPNLSSHPTTTGSFASLKTLHLRSVSHLTRNMIPILLSNCQLLESLKLVNCSGLQSLCITTDNGLKSLTVVDCPNIIDITVCAPNLQSFRYRGVLPRFHLNNISCLVDAMLDFRDGPGCYNFDCEELLSLLADIASIEILTLSGWLLQWLCSAGVIFRCLDFQFDNLKELWWIDSLIDRPKRDSMLCFLSICPFLERMFIDVDGRRNCISCPLFFQYWHEPHLWIDYTTVKACSLRLDHLKNIKMTGITDQEDELLLMDLLIKQGVLLESMIITSPENQSWRVVMIPRSQLKQRSRKHHHWKQIAIPSQEKEYYYEYIEEDTSGLCPSHGQLCM